MDALQELQAVSDAIRIVSDARIAVAQGATVVWAKLNRVAKYLDKQADGLLVEMV
jgi:hypothetical protein